jgi:hypothetical protein
MIASTFLLVRSEKWVVESSTCASAGTSFQLSGHLKAIGALRQAAVTDFAPYFQHCAPMSSAGRTRRAARDPCRKIHARGG